MKIAFVANTCWNIFNFRKGLVRHFLSLGYEVTVLAPKDEYTDAIQEWGVSWIETPLDGTGVNPIQDLKYLKSIYSTFKKKKPDVTLSFTIKSNIYSCLAGKFTDVPIICNVSGLGTVFLVKGFAGKMAIFLYKVAFRFASFIFFQNFDDKELFVSKIKVPDEKTGILPGSGINLKEFEFSRLVPRTPVNFLMISRLIIEKGVREYIEAASYFKNDDRVSFSLIGRLDDGHSRTIEKSDLDGWVNEKLINYYPHSDDIKKFITNHEVIVLPSYREGTPRTLLEGAAIGRALLTSDVPGCKDVVEDGFNGFLFQVKNTQSMIDKIKLYLSLSEDERIILASNSRKLVEDRFDEKLIIDKYVNVIHRIRVRS